MRSPRTPARPADHRVRRWHVLLALGSFVLVAVALTGIRLRGDINAVIHRPPAIDGSVDSSAEASIILVGRGSQRGDPFYLAGGTYRIDWAAWGAAPEYPPCAHSAELMAVDPANPTTSRAHVADLAKLVDVPASGGSDERYVANLKPGYYSLDIASECSWQFAVSSSS